LSAAFFDDMNKLQRHSKPTRQSGGCLHGLIALWDRSVPHTIPIVMASHYLAREPCDATALHSPFLFTQTFVKK
jgi:hypothetical protein